MNLAHVAHRPSAQCEGTRKPQIKSKLLKRSQKKTFKQNLIYGTSLNPLTYTPSPSSLENQEVNET